MANPYISKQSVTVLLAPHSNHYGSKPQTPHALDKCIFTVVFTLLPQTHLKANLQIPASSITVFICPTTIKAGGDFFLLAKSRRHLLLRFKTSLSAGREANIYFIGSISRYFQHLQDINSWCHALASLTHHSSQTSSHHHSHT